MLAPHFVVWIFSIGMMVLGAGAVFGQEYPQKTIRILTGGVGGSNDFASRLIAPGLARGLGQPVVVENRGAIPAAEAVAKAAPDGYNMLLGGDGLWLGPLLRKISYDPVRDFSPLTLLTSEPSILVVHPSVPATSVKELIALAKARPGQLNYAFNTIGGAPYVAAELFKAMAGVNIVGVAYKSGGAPLLSDLLSGYVQLTFQDEGFVGTQIASGKLRGLAVTSSQPSALFPGVPTMAASGLPGYEQMSMTGVFMPAKTPDAIIKRVNQEIVRVIRQPEITEKFRSSGSEVVGSSPEEFAAKMKASMATLGKLIKDAGIKVE